MLHHWGQRREVWGCYYYYYLCILYIIIYVQTSQPRVQLCCGCRVHDKIYKNTFASCEYSRIANMNLASCDIRLLRIGSRFLRYPLPVNNILASCDIRVLRMWTSLPAILASCDIPLPAEVANNIFASCDSRFLRFSLPANMNLHLADRHVSKH